MAETTAAKAAREDAARKRADYTRALEEELAAVKAQGKAERVKAVEAELARVKKGPKDRRDAEAAEA